MMELKPLLLFLTAACIGRASAGAADCKNDEYFTGYNCLQTQFTINPVTCPIDESKPPPDYVPTCQNGGNNFWYIHVGGKRTDWKRGTDALCLSIRSRPVPWGLEGCQFRWNREGCERLLEWAGCVHSEAEVPEPLLSGH
ncbi:uncharacterized protein LOC106174863 [Lingula anatina]|uniref:Uncharacterized protein LOC106174863 n=1 Tax=Lingula anatina TaxID=7574 RepID=A0A1S3JNU8_LINAN|nr:uncharacterized protein LOC106174863 [Lingula anatina]|eukprot:XP_013412043.1 uncharacterized protein LOC106174863 [Lingula anatina]